MTSPFLANYGQDPRVGFEPPETLPPDMITQARANRIAINDFVAQIDDINKHLQDEMLIAQAIQEVSANRNRRPCPQYFVGDQVFLDARNINTERLCVKLDDRSIGPDRVSKVFSNPLVV